MSAAKNLTAHCLSEKNPVTAFPVLISGTTLEFFRKKDGKYRL
jgi:hypothetical protein